MPCGAGPLCDRRAPGGGWPSAARVCGSLEPRSRLPAARAVSVARPPDDNTPLGACAPASSSDRLTSLPLDGWESEIASSSVSAPSASPTGYGAAFASRPALLCHVSASPFSCPARPRLAFIGAASSPQCLGLNSQSEPDHVLRGTRRFGTFPGSLDRRTWRSVAVGYPLLGKARFSERSLMPSLPGFFSVPHLAWRCALQLVRCAIRG